MSSFWVPQIGGQEYGMPGMVNDLYLQADEPGIYDGMNSNFTGEGMTHQKFNFVALEEDEYQNWVKETQENAPELTEETYEKLMLPDTVEELTFSNTHLDIVDHGIDSGEYAMKIRKKYGIEVGVQDKEENNQEESDSTDESNSHHHH
jgi:cytochrome aa3-600 menaquinol oxidase subunit 2